ncbi:hypothetical protein ACOMHN_024152 [Nucella lapillus]
MERIIFNITADITTLSPLKLVTCLLRHVTHVTLACDPHSLCSGLLERGGLLRTAACTMTQSTTPYFRCGGGSHDYVPYSLVCDWRADCEDESDESFCQFPPCSPDAFDCGKGQCIDAKQVGDGVVNCFTQLDEGKNSHNEIATAFNVTYPPALVNLDRPGSFTLIPLPDNSSQCPETHYKCPGNGYCLPIFTRCNRVRDCPGNSDEAECGDYTCEGLYRCRGEDRQICLHVKHLCDGWPQCPQHDDEVMCGVTQSCPDQCVCYGTTFTELRVFQPETFPKLRYLQGRGSGLSQDVILNQTMLIYLGAGACGWTGLAGLYLPNLLVLDISDNHFRSIHFQQFSRLRSLRELDISGNPLVFDFLGSDTMSYSLKNLLILNLSRVQSGHFHLTALSGFVPKVEMLDFSHTGLKSLQGRGLFRKLKMLDLQGCPVSEFSPEFLKHMYDLQQVLASTFKLCCPALLPYKYMGECMAPADEISSCDNLLKSGFYRAALAIFTVTAVLGNLVSFVYRLWPSSAKRKVGYTVFVIHLSVSDFLMGVYLLIVGLADRLFAGSYLWNESSWKKSTLCSIAGFVSLVSCEVSSFFICLITLDRFLVICFPFSRLRFGVVSAHVASLVTWVPGMILASIPLLPVTSHWAFYSQTGICIPLPVTRTDFPGQHYSFGVMIVLNMILFLLIALGQALIYWSVRANAMPGGSQTGKDSGISHAKTRSKETTVARRLLVIAMSDFLCWFPIGVSGLLSKLDIPVPGEVNVAMAILVLPLNSALNPFLYTYTVLREKRQRAKEARLVKFIAAQIGTMNR